MSIISSTKRTGFEFEPNRSDWTVQRRSNNTELWILRCDYYEKLSIIIDMVRKRYIYKYIITDFIHLSNVNCHLFNKSGQKNWKLIK